MFEAYEYLGYEKGYRSLNTEVKGPIDLLRLVPPVVLEPIVVTDSEKISSSTISTVEYELIDHNRSQAFYRRIGNDEADDTKQLKKLERDMEQLVCPIKRKQMYDRIRSLQSVVPTECCVCGDKMRGRHPQYSWTCSSSCARDHYD